MRAIPMIVSEEHYDLFIILEEENVRRIKEYDPAEFLTANLPAEFTSRKIHNVIIMYATPADLKQLNIACVGGDPTAGLRRLSRGFRWRPTRVDQDGMDGLAPEPGEDHG